MPFTHSAAEHVDLPGHFKPRQIACARRRWVRTTTLQHVRSVDARSRYTNTYFARAGRGIRPLDRSEHFRRPWFRNFNGAHRSTTRAAAATRSTARTPSNDLVHVIR